MGVPLKIASVEVGGADPLDRSRARHAQAGLLTLRMTMAIGCGWAAKAMTGQTEDEQECRGRRHHLVDNSPTGGCRPLQPRHCTAQQRRLSHIFSAQRRHELGRRGHRHRHAGNSPTLLDAVELQHNERETRTSPLSSVSATSLSPTYPSRTWRRRMSANSALPAAGSQPRMHQMAI
ncbi:hypothetical protein BJ912DRAFT_298096 [Pholiota molesta]|nr:hypothetical protein BJ912DRAFT_298096 [Pholiota molesta]